MIDKIYKCDICSDIVNPNHHGCAYRIKFVPKSIQCRYGFTLVPLVTSESASEKIICVECLKGLREIKL